MKRNLVYCYENDKPQSVRSFLKEQGYPKKLLCLFKQDPSLIQKNRQPVMLRDLLKKGDVLAVSFCDETFSPNILPAAPKNPQDLKIVYEDEDVIVCDKPAKVPVHPSQNHRSDSLANFLAMRFQKENNPFVFRCLNRLDLDTSGLVLIAKNALSAAVLQDELRNRQLRRTYTAIAAGKIEHDETIDLPIARKADSVILRCVDPILGVKAVTHLHPLCCEKDRTLLAISLETGRTHQIRVHLSHEGHPLLGDPFYGLDILKDYSCSIRRQALHSCRLSFYHPVSKKKILLTSAPPEDFQQELSFRQRGALQDFLNLDGHTAESDLPVV